ATAPRKFLPLRRCALAKTASNIVFFVPLSRICNLRGLASIFAVVIGSSKRFVMEKIILSLPALAALIAMTILQACVGTTGTAGTAGAQCGKPKLTPSDASNAITSVRVTIATATAGAYLRYTLDGSTPSGGSSGNGTQIAAARGKVLVEFGANG